MVIRAAPTDTTPTHHVKLSDGVTDVGLILCDTNGAANPRAFARSPYPRSALKIYQGEQTYADLEPPFTPVGQSDWSGGRGMLDFESASNRFYDSQFLNTSREDSVVLGGQEILTLTDTGYRNWPHHNAGGAVKWYDYSLLTNRFIAIKFTASATHDVNYIAMMLRKIGDPADLTVEICADNSGSPGTVARTITITASKQDAFVLTTNLASFTATSLTSAAVYWIKIYAAGTDSASNYWSVLCVNTGSASATSKTSTNDSTWTNSAYQPVYVLTGNSLSHVTSKLFLYKNCLYLVKRDGSIFMNGYHGLASGGTGTTLTVSGTPWVADEWIGCIVLVYAGTGSQEIRNWAMITDNDASSLTVEWTWGTNPSTDSEFVILGSDKWTAVTGTGAPTAVTNVVVWNGHAYFAQGDATDIVRMRRYNNSGTWTTTFTTETGLRGTHIIVQPDGSTANIWWANRNNQVHYTASVAEGSNLGSATDLTVGDPYDRITGLLIYGEEYAVWVFKEFSVYELKYASSTYTPYKFRLDEIASAGDYRNGLARVQHNVYMYFSLQNTIQRYYSNTLDSVGPNLDDGLPEEYNGIISALAGYPGRLICAVDPETVATDADRYASILMHNGQGWHSLFAGQPGNNTSQRIWSMIIQTLPADHTDRMWFGWGPFVVWQPMDLNAFTHPPEEYNFYNYRPEGWLITGWMHVGLKDVQKFWSSLKIISDNLSDSTTSQRTIAVEYQVDQGNWTALGEFDTSFAEEQNFTAANTLTGRRLRLRLRLKTNDNSETPKLLSTVVEAVTRIQYKYQTQLTFRVADGDFQLDGQPDTTTLDTKLTQIETWASSASPIKLYAVSRQFNDTTVLVEPSSVRVLHKIHDTHSGAEAHICQLTLIEI